MKRILLVDDEPHVIRIMKLALIRAGYHVDEASNGVQAMASIARDHPDVLITDINMPRMDGRELCRQIEETLPDRNFRIYLLTARAEDEHRRWSSSIQNLGFLEKPVSIRNLVTHLHDYFSGQLSGKEETCLTAQSTP